MYGYGLSILIDWMFPKRLDRPELLCDTSSPLAEMTGGELKFLVGLWQHVSVLMSLALAHQLLHMRSIVSLIDPWVVEPSVTPAFALFKEPNLLVMVELSVFKELSVCTPLEQMPAAVALDG